MQPWVRKNINFGREERIIWEPCIITVTFCFHAGNPQLAVSPVNRPLGLLQSSRRQINTSLKNLDNLSATMVEGDSRTCWLYHTGSWEVQCTEEHGVPGCEGGWSHSSEHPIQAKSGEKHLLETAITCARGKEQAKPSQDMDYPATVGALVLSDCWEGCLS